MGIYPVQEIDLIFSNMLDFLINGMLTKIFERFTSQGEAFRMDIKTEDIHRENINMVSLDPILFERKLFMFLVEGYGFNAGISAPSLFIGGKFEWI